MTDQQPEQPQYPTPPEPKPVSTPTIALKWWHLLIAIVVVAALSVGCTLLAVNLTKPDAEASSEPETQQPVNTPESEPKEDLEIPKAETSERGYLIKRIGDKSALLKSDGETEIASWKLTGIDVDASCTAEYSQPSENGHFVILSFDVETGKDLIEVHGYPFMLAAGGQWQYYLADGTLWNGDPIYGNALSCLAQTERLPDSIGASTKASGKIAFDLPTTDGVLVFSDNGGIDGWEYPLKEHPTA